jgi:hypothetical protein
LGILDKANKGFLNELADLRESYSHSLFTIDKFQLVINNGKASITEPNLNGML